MKSQNALLDTYQNAANQARGLAIDAIEQIASGHLGLPLGCAEIGAMLFGEVMNFDPKKPDWLNRDRFILSAGHGSMFLYAWLHISGYDLSIEDISKFRHPHSKTPGHPEYGATPGVEVTSGPLGQGIGNAVGMAMAQKMAAAKYNSAAEQIFDHRVYCLAGDGCMQEGVSAEAASFAGHQQLDNLVLMYDSNDVTLDAMACKTQSCNAKKRFESYGFEVFQADGHNFDEIRKAFRKAKKTNGKPKLIIFKTVIAKGIPEVEASAKGHGEGGAKFAAEARKMLGLPEQKYFVSDETYAFYGNLAKKRARARRRWEKLFAAWATNNPGLAEHLEASCCREPFALVEDVMSKIPPFADGKAATRADGGRILNDLSKALPNIVTGAADLFGSTKNYIKDGGDFGPENREGKNIWFGIREHAMGAILNGMAYYGIFTASGATFLTFAGYMLPPVRIAALAKLPVQYFFTHDSVAVGFDGPTHQPVELVAQLRCIPNLHVIRPADGEECAAAYALAYARQDGPTALILTRQDVPQLAEVPAEIRRRGTLRGAYVAKAETSPLTKIVIATGSELQHALEAARSDAGIRVVSMPCMEIFERQSEDYRESVLPGAFENVVAIEAGRSIGWCKYAKKVIATDDFGFSADTPFLLEHFKLNAQAVLDA